MNNSITATTTTKQW